MESTRAMAREAAARKNDGSRQWQGHKNKFAGFGTQFSGRSTTFFFYNFSRELETKFLWNCFHMYGKVVDVYVPSKRDKRGKRFGFVRLTGIDNEIQMEKKLNGIWIGSYKMRVKITDDRQRKPLLSRKLQGAVKENGTKSKMYMLVQPGQSYAQAMRGQGKRAEKAPIQSQDKEEEATLNKDSDKTRVEESMVEETREEIIEFTQWMKSCTDLRVAWWQW
ncbi:hypothetical protein SLA2020_017440 [Shorea laevis]